MKTVIALFLCAAFALAYDDIPDDKIPKLLTDEKQLRQIFGCIVDVDTCDDLGTHAKSHVVEVLADDCRECDLLQKQTTHAFINKLRNDYPDLYEKFEAKYDPTRTLLQKLDEEMLKYSS